MIKVTHKLTMRFPDLLLADELLEIAKREIIPDIHKKMDKGMSISNVSYGGLSPLTIKQKAKKGLNPKILHATGQLRRSIDAQKANKQSVVIFLSGNRKEGKTNSDLGNILQNEGVRTKSGKRFFEFFGISEEAQARAINYMKGIIRERIQNAR